LRLLPTFLTAFFTADAERLRSEIGDKRAANCISAQIARFTARRENAPVLD